MFNLLRGVARSCCGDAAPDEGCAEGGGKVEENMREAAPQFPLCCTSACVTKQRTPPEHILSWAHLLAFNIDLWQNPLLSRCIRYLQPGCSSSAEQYDPASLGLKFVYSQVIAEYGVGMPHTVACQQGLNNDTKVFWGSLNFLRLALSL